MFHYEIEFINSYGYIINSFSIQCKTEKQAISAAKKEKITGLYPEIAWIEIVCLETKKRIYA